MSYCLCTHTQFVLCSCLGTLKCTRPRNIPFALFLDNLQSFRMFWFDLWYVEISTRGLWCTQSEAWVETNQWQQRVSINWPIRGRVKDLAIISCCNILWDGKHDWNLEFMSTDLHQSCRRDFAGICFFWIERSTIIHTMSWPTKRLRSQSMTNKSSFQITILW